MVTLILTFITGFFVGKSYAANDKDIKQDVPEKIASSASQGKELKTVGEKIPEKSNHNAKKSTKQNTIKVEETPISQDEEDIKKQESIEDKPLGKVVYLTFDDGPSKLTDQFLDVLHEQDVKATFFMQGSNLSTQV